MNTMKQAKNAEAFEQLLFSYVEMCYAVALVLTHDRDDAQDLTREVLSEVWQRRDMEDAATNIKCTLLFTMRKHFTEHYWQPSQSLGKNPAIMERT